LTLGWTEAAVATAAGSSKAEAGLLGLGLAGPGDTDGEGTDSDPAGLASRPGVALAEGKGTPAA